MDDARLEPAPLHALLELAVAAGVDDDDRVEVGGGDLVEVAVEHARAVVGAQDRVGAGRPPARRGARQLDVLAEALDHGARLAPDAEAVAQVARVLKADPRTRAPLAGRVARPRPGPPPPPWVPPAPPASPGSPGAPSPPPPSGRGRSPAPRGPSSARASPRSS